MPKSSFVLYLDYKKHFDLIQDDGDFRRLIEAIFAYCEDGSEPYNLSPVAEMAFSFVRANLDRDNGKYNETKDRRKKYQKNKTQSCSNDKDLCKPIETHYGGYRFRSRLEARWAVFFDALGIRYEYEKEGYKLASGKYLPDFWLPDWKMWVEIKGRTPSECEQRLASELFQATSFACCIFTNPREYGRIFCLDSTESASGIFESSFAKWCWNTQANSPCIAIYDAGKRHRTFHSLNFEADYSYVVKKGSCGVAESSFAIKNAIDAFNSARFEFGR